MKIQNGTKILFSVAVTTGVVACGGKSGSSSSVAPSAVAGAIVAAQNQVKQANIVHYSAPVSSSSVGPSLPGIHVMSASSMSGSYFTSIDSNIGNLYCGSGNTCGTSGHPSFTSSPKKWLGNMLDPSFKNDNDGAVGLIGRLVENNGMACVVSQILGGSSVPDAGVRTVVINTAVVGDANTVCGTALTVPAGQNFAVAVTITDVSSGGVFDRKLHMVNADMDLDQTLLVKITGTVTRVMSTQGNSEQGYPYSNRYFVDYDSSTGISRFEGIEKGFPTTNGQGAGFYFYRLWVNSNSHEVRILGQNGGLTVTSGSPVRQQSVMVGGIGNTTSNLATFEFLTKYTSGSTASDYIGCIDVSAGSVSSGGVCSGHTLDLSAADTLINTTIFGMSQGSWKVDETISAMSFDATTIFSAAMTN